MNSNRIRVHFNRGLSTEVLFHIRLLFQSHLSKWAGLSSQTNQMSQAFDLIYATENVSLLRSDFLIAHARIFFRTRVAAVDLLSLNQTFTKTPQDFHLTLPQRCVVKTSFVMLNKTWRLLPKPLIRLRSTAQNRAPPWLSGLFPFQSVSCWHISVILIKRFFVGLPRAFSLHAKWQAKRPHLYNG